LLHIFLNNVQKYRIYNLNNVHNMEDAMFKVLLTIFRGANARVHNQIVDQHALLILEQQIRDSVSALERAKKALAIAIAQDQQEERRLNDIKRRLEDMETRVCEALFAKRDDLSMEGAQVIAQLEGERDSAQTAHTLFASEITRLKAHVQQAQGRITAIQQEQRIAKASEAVRVLRRGRIDPALPHESTLSEAETTLKRLREKQQETQLAEDALDALNAATHPLTVAEKLAEHGFGPRLKSTADDVLTRLKARVNESA
jgi:phage shock protein A